MPSRNSPKNLGPWKQQRASRQAAEARQSGRQGRQGGFVGADVSTGEIPAGEAVKRDWHIC